MKPGAALRDAVEWGYMRWDGIRVVWDGDGDGDWNVDWEWGLGMHLVLGCGGIQNDVRIDWVEWGWMGWNSAYSLLTLYHMFD